MALPVGWLVACAGTGTAGESAAPPLAPTPLGACGGLGAFPCDPDQTCLDAPDDGCDPDQGGADCAGQCYACEDPGLARAYASRDPEECARIDYDCDPGTVAFTDACGCGCA